MAHVFISYKSSDYDFVQSLKQQLEDAGIVTWIDKNIRGGDDWREAIDQAIRDSFATVTVMSPEAKTSEYVTYEWAFALGIGISVIPIMYQITPLHPRLEVLQYLDFTDRLNRPWDQLIERLTQLEAGHDPAQIGPISPTQDVPAFVQSSIDMLNQGLGFRGRGNGISHQLEQALQTLANANHPAAIEAIANAAHDPDRNLRIRAALILAETTFYEDKRALPGLLDALTYNDEAVRKSAVQSLGSMADPAAIPALFKVAEDKMIEEEAIQALIQIGPAALNALHRLIFKSPNLQTAIIAVRSLRLLGEDALPLLIKTVNTHPNVEIAYRAMYALADYGDPSTIKTFVKALRRGNPETRWTAISALGEFDDPAAVDALTKALKDPEKVLVGRAIESLKRIGTPEALEAVAQWEAKQSSET